MTKTIAMIPARLGSQRLKKKNLQEIDGVPLITRAIRKAVSAQIFSEVWVNSEAEIFGAIAAAEGVKFYHRSPSLADNVATSEDYIFDFFQNVNCERLVQIHSIAPLLSTSDIRSFVSAWSESEFDTYLACIEDQIEVAFNGRPVNFSFNTKTNSQDLQPTQRITWALSGWTGSVALAAKAAGMTLTYSGAIGFHPVSPLAGHVVKTKFDLEMACTFSKILGAEA